MLQIQEGFNKPIDSFVLSFNWLPKRLENCSDKQNSKFIIKWSGGIRITEYLVGQINARKGLGFMSQYFQDSSSHLDLNLPNGSNSKR